MFTVPDTETDPEIETDSGTDKSAQTKELIWHYMLVSVSVQYEHLYTILCNSFFIGLGVGKCGLKSEVPTEVVTAKQGSTVLDSCVFV